MILPALALVLALGHGVEPGVTPPDARLTELDAFEARLVAESPDDRALLVEQVRTTLEALDARKAGLTTALLEAETPAAQAALLDELDGVARAEVLARLQLRAADVSEAPASSAADRAALGHELVVHAGEEVRDALVVGADLVVRGVVHRHAVAVGGTVRVRPGGRVDGEAVAFGGEVELDPGARVAGLSGQPEADQAAGALLLDGPLPVRGLARRLVPALLAAALVLLVRALAPLRVERARARLRARPTLAVGVGALAVLAAAAVVALTGGSTVGIPLVAAAGTLLLGTWAVGFAALAEALTHAVVPAPLAARAEPVAVVLLLALGASVPLAGPVALLLLALPALGAAGSTLGPRAVA